jgi:hypothetical protein
MLANGLGQMAKGAEATARRPATPPVKFSFGKLALGVCVKRWSADDGEKGFRDTRLAVAAGLKSRIELLPEDP